MKKIIILIGLSILHPIWLFKNRRHGMFKWIRKLFRKNRCLWYVEGWEYESDLDYNSGAMSGPFKTERKAMDWAKKHYDEGLWNVDIMWRP